MTTDTVDTIDKTETKTADTSTKTETKTTDAKTDKTSTTDDKKTTTTTTDSSDYDWRGKLAGEDKKFLKELERFTDEPAFANAYKDVRSKATDPRRLMIPGEDASDEDRAAYAKARKIPDDPKKYEIKVKPPEGYEVTEADKTRLDALTARFHKRGGILADPEVVNAIHEAYYLEQEEAAAFAEATAIRQRELTQGQITKLWPGNEGKRNVSFAQAAVEHYFGKAWEKVKDRQFADGSLLGDDFDFLQAFAKIGRDHVEDPVFLEAGRNGVDPANNLEQRKMNILSMKYFDPKKFAELTKPGGELEQIYAALERHNQRGQAA
jgi:hypothetical protein